MEMKKAVIDEIPEELLGARHTNYSKMTGSQNSSKGFGNSSMSFFRRKKQTKEQAFSKTKSFIAQIIEKEGSRDELNTSKDEMVGLQSTIDANGVIGLSSEWKGLEPNNIAKVFISETSSLNDSCKSSTKKLTSAVSPYRSNLKQALINEKSKLAMIPAPNSIDS